MFGAGLTQGALGFGFPTISTPILVLMTDVKTAIVLNLLPNFTVNVIGIARGGNWGASLGRYWPVAAWVLVGAFLGAQFLIRPPQEPIRVLLGLAILAYLYQSVLAHLDWSWLTRNGRLSAMGFGLTGGFFSGTRPMVPRMMRIRPHIRCTAVLAALLATCTFHSVSHAAESDTAKAQRLWAKSPHGAMLERILPRVIEPRDLPEARSEGARLTVRYCVQCHHLVNPAMHTATRWRSVVDRMVWRMRGNGNMGALMKEMMAKVEAPSDRKVETLLRYLQKHAQAPIDPKHPALTTKAGGIFVLACSQCHALPDPQRHTAREWPEVVARMKQHLAWTNRVVGNPELKTLPELNTDEIVKLLQRYARRE